MLTAPGLFPFGDGGSQRQETSDALRQALLINDNLPLCARLHHLAQKGQEPAVPACQLLRREGQPPHRGAGVELLIDPGDDGRASTGRPVPHQVHHQHIVRPSLAPDLTPGRRCRAHSLHISSLAYRGIIRRATSVAEHRTRAISHYRHLLLLPVAYYSGTMPPYTSPPGASNSTPGARRVPLDFRPRGIGPWSNSPGLQNTLSLSGQRSARWSAPAHCPTSLASGRGSA